ncbi:unnamed protein product [Ambrosiozyma monospora]|uniref:Unnamed protein product n=1 Tax=Ambrosiozyma monospora TaxID=43982 RepID=A0ACB5TI62_AMBMO|nr:unnamed protein product [Ambrosiozyma monospora]
MLVTFVLVTQVLLVFHLVLVIPTTVLPIQYTTITTTYTNINLTTVTLPCSTGGSTTSLSTKTSLTTETLVIPITALSSYQHRASGSAYSSAAYSDAYITVTDIHTTDLEATITVSCSACTGTDSSASVVSNNREVTNVFTVPVSALPTADVSSAGSNGTVTLTTVYSTDYFLTVTVPCSSAVCTDKSTASVATQGKIVTQSLEIPLSGVPSAVLESATRSFASGSYASVARASGYSAGASAVHLATYTITTSLPYTETATRLCYTCEQSLTTAATTGSTLVTTVVTLPVTGSNTEFPSDYQFKVNGTAYPSGSAAFHDHSGSLAPSGVIPSGFAISGSDIYYGISGSPVPSHYPQKSGFESGYSRYYGPSGIVEIIGENSTYLSTDLTTWTRTHSTVQIGARIRVSYGISLFYCC